VICPDDFAGDGAFAGVEFGLAILGSRVRSTSDQRKRCEQECRSDDCDGCKPIVLLSDRVNLALQPNAAMTASANSLVPAVPPCRRVSVLALIEDFAVCRLNLAAR